MQGVGFRPFVYRLARAHGLAGSVRNGPLGVVIEAEGDRAAIERFLDAVQATPPPAARIQRTGVVWDGPSPVNSGRFVIDTSVRTGEPALFPSPDLTVCAACLAELGDPGDRRHGYPLLNCTQCGPRYTIIRALPYDRERTSMAAFAMCPA